MTHEPFFPPSGGGSAEAVYLVEELARRGHDAHIFCPQIADADKIERRFGVHLHLFKKWKMGRYARLRNLKYLAYPFCLERMAAAAAEETHFNLILSQHAISAVAAGKLKAKLKVPVVMNFPDLLTGFMETWPAWAAPRPLVHALERYEISLPVRYGVDGVLTVSDTLADYFTERGFPPESVCPIYYGYDADRFSFVARSAEKGRPPIIVMHGSFDAHHLGKIALGAIGFVTKRKPDAIFRFVGRETSALQAFLRRAKKDIPGFKFETTGFVAYDDVAKHLANANVGMVPYEESAGTHCAFVAKVVEYVASGLPSVCTPLKSIQRYFRNEPMIRFSEFDGEDFGRKIVSWLEESPLGWQIEACNSAARVQAELDWQPLCRGAVNFIEEIYARSSNEKNGLGKSC
ncbi:MAG: glycosyltransferase family 4 protein [Limisphaerales bacterium]